MQIPVCVGNVRKCHVLVSRTCRKSYFWCSDKFLYLLCLEEGHRKDTALYNHNITINKGPLKLALFIIDLRPKSVILYWYKYTANSFCSIHHFNCYSIVLIWNFIVEDLGGEKNKALYTEKLLIISNLRGRWSDSGGKTVICRTACQRRKMLVHDHQIIEWCVLMFLENNFNPIDAS